MNKKQTLAFLKVMGKDISRDKLRSAYVDKWDDRVVLVTTNGYILAAIYMDEDAEPAVGKMIRREAIERWYKLATGKSRLTGDELVKVLNDDYTQEGSYKEGAYVDWKRLVMTSELAPQKRMRFNAEFFKIVQDVDGADDLTVELRGEVAPMNIHTDRGFYIVMPMVRS